MYVNKSINNQIHDSYNEKLQSFIVPSILNRESSEITISRFQSDFKNVGTKDYVAPISIKYALEWRNQVNDTRIISYNHNLGANFQVHFFDF